MPATDCRASEQACACAAFRTIMFYSSLFDGGGRSMAGPRSLWRTLFSPF
jgi:hypothetical protein